MNSAFDIRTVSSTFIFNPRSGHNARNPYLLERTQAFIAEHRLPAEIQLTAHPRHATQLAADALARGDAGQAPAHQRRARGLVRRAELTGQHGVGSGEEATAVAYVQLRIGSDRTVYGVGFDVNIVTATLRAAVSAANRAQQREWLALRPVKRAVPV